MLRTNSSDVWRGGWKRQRGKRAPLWVSLPAAVGLCSPGFTFPCAALRPLLLRLSAAGGHRFALSRFSGVPSCVSAESATRGHLTPFTDKVPSGQRGRWLSDSSAAERAPGCGVRPLRWSVPQVERTTSRERWALSAPRRGLPSGFRSPGAEEPLLCWAHLWVQLRHHVSYRRMFAHKLFSFTHHCPFGSVFGWCHYLQMCLAKEVRCFHDLIGNPSTTNPSPFLDSGAKSRIGQFDIWNQSLTCCFVKEPGHWYNRVELGNLDN